MLEPGDKAPALTGTTADGTPLTLAGKALSAGGPPVSPKAYLEAAEQYRPYRSYAVLHLWRQG